jgi:hypothetical protein
MNKPRFVAILALSLPVMAEAASVATPIVGCKAEADAKRILEFIAKNDSPGLEKFRTPKITNGDCSFLTKGMPIAIDKKDGQFLCVHPIGGRRRCDKSKSDRTREGSVFAAPGPGTGRRPPAAIPEENQERRPPHDLGI